MESTVRPNSDNKDDVTYQLQEGIDAVGFGKYQMKLAAIIGFVYMTDAMEMMLLSFLGPAVLCEDWDVSSTQESLLTTAVFAGMLIGATICGRLSDRIGRRRTVIFSAVGVAAFGLASAIAPSYAFLMVCRFFTGFFFGGVPTAFTYFLEFVPSPHRGALGVWAQALWTLGTMLEAGLGWALLESAGWRWLLAASALPAVIALPLLCFIPDSPRYCIIAGKRELAQDILQDMARVNGRPLPTGSLVYSEPETLSMAAVVRELFGPVYRRNTLCLYAMWFVNAFAYYGLLVLTTELTVSKDGETGVACHGPGKSPFTSKDFGEIFVDSLAEFPGLVLSAALVDRIGRRWTQGGEFCATAVFTLLLLIPSGRAVQTVLLFGARAAIFGAFAVTYLYSPELYPTAFRTTAFGLANAWARVGGMLAPFVGQALVQEGSLTLSLLIFSAAAGVASVCSMLLTVETAGAGMADTTKGAVEMAAASKGVEGFARLHGEHNSEEDHGTKPPSAGV